MTRRAKAALPMLMFCSCLLYPSLTCADAVLVTGGSAAVRGPGGFPFTLIGDDFLLVGGANNGVGPFNIGPAGATLSIQTFNSGSDVRSGGPGTFEGVFYPQLFFGPFAFLRFTGSFVVPDDPSTNITLTTPFQFVGRLGGCTTRFSPLTGLCPPENFVFDLNLIGQGTAVVSLVGFDTPAGRRYEITGFTYEFEGPPKITSITATPSILWPPNHKLVHVLLDVVAAGSPSPTCQIRSVTSNEQSMRPGENDWVVTGPLAVDLRAERAGSGDGRVYTITVTCTNRIDSASQTATVFVPHDQGK